MKKKSIKRTLRRILGEGELLPSVIKTGEKGWNVEFIEGKTHIRSYLTMKYQSPSMEEDEWKFVYPLTDEEFFVPPRSKGEGIIGVLSRALLDIRGGATGGLAEGDFYRINEGKIYEGTMTAKEFIQEYTGNKELLETLKYWTRKK